MRLLIVDIPQTEARMSLHVNQIETGNTVHNIPQMDLEKIIGRVVRENPDWTPGRVARAVADYRQFWRQCKTTPGGNKPTKDVDVVWHAHILYTKQYASDCQAYFGHFLHHSPQDAQECDDCSASHECDAVRPQSAKCCTHGNKCSNCRD